MWRRFIPLLVAGAAWPLLAPRVGRKTYVPGLAFGAKKLLKYIQKYQTQLAANLSGDALACITGIQACLVTLISFLEGDVP